MNSDNHDGLIIDGRAVGSGACFVIAEAGVNHNGRADLAHELVDAAAAAHSDAVKFQVFDATTLATPGAPLAEYQQGSAANDQRSLLEPLALSHETFVALQRHAREVNLSFLATPFDAASAEFLDRIGVPAFKIASGELTNHLLLERIAQYGRPMLLSTGMATMEEVGSALRAVRRSRAVPLALFHCVSSYPARPVDCNLLAIDAMRMKFKVPTGWSDHTDGIDIAIGAAALGAALLEKHLTLDRSMPGPDHAASVEPADFRRLVEAVRRVSVARGDGRKRPVEAEVDTMRVARKSLYWARGLPAGVTIGLRDITALRPATADFPASKYADIVGRRTVRAVKEGRPIQPGDVLPE